MIIEGVPRKEAISRLGLKPNTYDTKLRRLRQIFLDELRKDLTY